MPLGLYASEMSGDEMEHLITLIQAFGDLQRVGWTAPKWLEEQAEQLRV